MAKLSANGTEWVRTKRKTAIEDENNFSVVVTSFRSNRAILLCPKRIENGKVVWNGGWTHRKVRTNNGVVRQKIKPDFTAEKCLDVLTGESAKLRGIEVTHFMGSKFNPES